MAEIFTLTSIKTRGTVYDDHAGIGWTATFKLACSQDGTSFLFADPSGTQVAALEDGYEFEGNTDGSGVVTNDLSGFGLDCRHVRFYPQNITGGGGTVLELFDGKINL